MVHCMEKLHSRYEIGYRRGEKRQEVKLFVMIGKEAIKVFRTSTRAIQEDAKKIVTMLKNRIGKYGRPQ